MTARKIRLVPGVARLDAPRKPTKQRKRRQRPQIQAWHKAAEAKR